MQNFPTLKTAIPELVLQPFTTKHVPFMVELLSNREIQKTLLRVPAKITAEQQEKGLEKMYEYDLPKEITYILTLKRFLSETHIGYVRIRIINWQVKSCYLSVAILPSDKFRNKGYAKAAYDAFFTYLFSLGFMKIYGRTYESNMPTMRLNEATGFNFVGRQKDFILYPNKTSLDALLYERINPALVMEYQKTYTDSLKELEQILIPLVNERKSGKVAEQVINQTIENLRNFNTEKLLIPFKTFVTELQISLEKELANPYTTHKMTPLVEYLRDYRSQNASFAGFPVLAYPLTIEQIAAEHDLAKNIALLIKGRGKNLPELSSEVLEQALEYGAYTAGNWEYLRHLFLGKMVHSNLGKCLADIYNKRIPIK